MSTSPPAVPSPQPDPTPQQSVPVVASPGARSSVWWSIFGWVFVGGLAWGAWHYQAQWLPHLERYLGQNKTPPPKGPRIVPVSVAAVQRRDMPLYLNGLGTVTAFKTVTIRSRVEGELTKVHFTEGQMVKEGDLLAEIDKRPYEVQLAQAEGQLARDEATLKTAKTTLSRYEGLLASKSIAAQQVDDQVTLVQQTMAGIQTDEATIANAKLQLTYCRITAPISGRIGLRLVDQGNMVQANSTVGLAVITQLQPIALTFTIPQDDIGRVQQRSNAGQPLKVDAYDRDFKQKLATGELLAIDNQVDAATGTVRLKAQFANEDGMLFPNQFVNARLLVDTKRNAILVPTAAVQRGPTSMYVYVVKTVEVEEKTDGGVKKKTEETVELRNVVVGPSEGAETSIESGLEAGEIIVTDGLDKLQSGAKVSTRDKSKEGDKGKAGKGGDKETEKKGSPKPTPAAEDSGKPTPDRGTAPAKPKPDPSTETEPVRATADRETERPSAEPPPSSGESKPKAACGEEETPEGRDTP